MSMPAQESSRASANLVLVNGKITTNAASNSAFEALAISGERVLAVGTNQAVRALAASDATIVDLEGRRVIPGLLDSHLHHVRAGQTWNDELHWDGLTSMWQGMAMLARATLALPAGTWLRVVGGWGPGQFHEGRRPTRAELNAICPRHPVYIQLLYDHALLNDAALQACGITRETQDPPGGAIERDASGEPTGIIRGTPAFNAVLNQIAQPTLEQRIASTLAMMRAFTRAGLTMGIDCGGLGASWDIYQPIFTLRERGDFPFRTRLYCGATARGGERQQIADWLERFRDMPGDDLLRFAGAGEIIHYGYHDLEGLTQFQVSPEARREFTEVTRMVVAAGWPMTVHAVWDTTIAAVLDVWEEINAETLLAGRRFSIAHADMISDADLARAQRLGIGITIQDRLVYRAADSARAWGDEAVHRAPPVRQILDLGIPVGAGTDSTRVASFNPWLSLWWLITGASIDGQPPRAARHRLSRAEALHLYTSGSAWFSQDEEQLGTLEPGKLADLAVLSDDYFNVEAERIPTLESMLTLVSGRPVYAAPAFTGLIE